MNIQGKYIKYEKYVALEEKCADLSEKLNLISDLIEYALRVFSQKQKKKEKPYADIAILLAILEAAEHRIAELEARAVTLPAEKFCPSEYAGSQYWEETEVWNKAISACAVAVRAAGIKVKGE